MVSDIFSTRSDKQWIGELWEFVVAAIHGDYLPAVGWLDRPAVSRITASKPGLLKPFADWNRGKEYRSQVKPFNFLLAVQPVAASLPDDIDPSRFQLMAPYNPAGSQWRKLSWTDRYSSKSYRITTGRPSSASTIQVKSYGDVLADYQSHPEWKSRGPQGEAPDRRTVGLLTRRHVEVSGIRYIGKESNQLEDVEFGLVHDRDEVLTEYSNPNEILAEALFALDSMTRQEVADAIGISKRAYQAIRNGNSRPRKRTLRKLVELAKQVAQSLETENATDV
ncbi:MAG: helix-turn-helix transcriptional regulator [Dehalococcoidia bacterium]